jgi:hypothetical protein
MFVRVYAFSQTGLRKSGLRGSLRRSARWLYPAGMTDRLSTLYQDLLSGSYDCVDRIVPNAYFRMGHARGNRVVLAWSPPAEQDTTGAPSAMAPR